MKMDLAVWTAVNGYDWQPGSVYSPRELAGYKDEIGPLVPDSLPLGGLFIKDGKVVFYRVQIAERMDSRGRGAIYCVLGTVPEDKAKEIDFSVVFKSPEMANPQKPFPTTIEYRPEACEYKSPLGRTGFDEKRFTGVETFSELGGWCEETKGGRLNVRITGSMDVPLFIVRYKPNTGGPVVELATPPPQLSKPQPIAYSEVLSRPEYKYPSREKQVSYGENMNSHTGGSSQKHVKTQNNSSRLRFVAGFVFGMAIMATVWVAWSAKKGESVNIAPIEPNPVQQEQKNSQNEIPTTNNNSHVEVIPCQNMEHERGKGESEKRKESPKCDWKGVLKIPSVNKK